MAKNKNTTPLVNKEAIPASKKSTTNKLHKKNRYNQPYDLKALGKSHPALKAFIINNRFNNQLTIDFSNADAVKALNGALLKCDFALDYWHIPEGYLCPPIPGRLDYIHYLADLLSHKINPKHETNKSHVSVLDIGTGASCIYPILGQREFQWHFVATDIDPISISAANQNISKNKALLNTITLRQQIDKTAIFKNIIKPSDYFHLTMCNPPFHKSLEEASEGSKRKWRNLAKKSKTLPKDKSLNFGGQKAELWCDGGEVAFIRQMIIESKQFKQQVLWFTCLIAKKDHLSAIKLSLKKAHVTEFKIVKMAQGQKISRFIAWRF